MNAEYIEMHIVSVLVVLAVVFGLGVLVGTLIN